jgi:hypothetical protein
LGATSTCIAVLLGPAFSRSKQYELQIMCSRESSKIQTCGYRRP